jgi:Glycosyltransferase Family 4
VTARSGDVSDSYPRRHRAEAVFGHRLLHRVIVRIAVITESFPPDVNGVAHCVLRVAEHLVRRGHQPLVIAPRPAEALPRPDSAVPYPVVRVPSLPMPCYPGFRIARAGPGLRAALSHHGTDLVHLASPFVLGGGGAVAAARLRLPMVAVYQTDVAGYARAYRLGPAGQAAAWRRLRRIHNAADRTLAPSTAAAADLHAHGIERVWLWARGVDTTRFDPAKRSERLRAELAPGGEVLAGYVGSRGQRAPGGRPGRRRAARPGQPGGHRVPGAAGGPGRAGRGGSQAGRRSRAAGRTLRASFDPARIASAAAHTVGALRAAGAEVLTMRLPDPGRMLGLPGSMARPLARRAHEINAIMDGVAARFGTLHYDAAEDPATHDPAMWAVDRLHPNERGHRLIACRFYDKITAAGLPTGPRPDAEPSSPAPTRLAEIGWLATRGTAWVLRRCTDLAPGLVVMAIKERWAGEDPASATMEHVAAEPRAPQAR